LIRPAVTSILIVLLSATWLPAQDVSEKAEGIICRQPECDLRRSIPANIDIPNESAPVFVERVKRLPASALDAVLPGIPFELWLFGTLRPYLSRGLDEPFAYWGLSVCDEPASAFPLASPDLCLEISVPVVEGRVVQSAIRVATGYWVNGVTGWREIVPDVRSVHIERLDERKSIDSLDVASLSRIEDRLRLPFNEWPTVDLKTQVTWLPGIPKPGESVRFTFSITNAGQRDADRAEVMIYIAVPLNNEDLKEIRRYWFPRVPAGKAVSLDIAATLGRGDATIVVQAAARGLSKSVREVNGEDNEVIAEIPLIR